SARDLAKQEPTMSAVQVTELEQTLNKLSVGENRLLHRVTLKSEPHEQQYEIYHTSLGPALLDWRIRYLQEHQEAEYKQKLRAEKQVAERRWRLAFWSAIAAVIVLLALTAIFLFLIKSVRKARKEADRQEAQKSKLLEIVRQQVKLVQQQDRAVK